MECSFEVVVSMRATKFSTAAGVSLVWSSTTARTREGVVGWAEKSA